MFSLGHRCVCICLLLTFSYSPLIRILSLQCAEINPHSVLPFSMLSIKWEPGYYWAGLRCISLEAARLHQQTSSCDFDRDSTCLVHWPGSRATVGSTGIANCSVFKSSQHKPAPFSAKHPLLPREAPHSWGKNVGLILTPSLYQQEVVTGGPRSTQSRVDVWLRAAM